MLKLVKEDYENMLSDLGSNQDPFSSEKEFIEWVGRNIVEGQQYSVIEKYLNAKFNTDVKIYNRKEGRQAINNAYMRLKDWVLGDDYQESEGSSSQKENEQKESQSTGEDESIEVNYRSIKEAVEFFIYKNPSIDEEDTIDCTGDNVHYKGKNIIIEDGIGLVDFDANKYTCNIIVLLNNQNNVVATGYLKKCDDDYRIATNPDSTIRDSWGNNSSFKVLIFPKETNNYLNSKKYKELFEDSSVTSNIRYVSIKITERERTISESPLCIDFGTSNTTAGYFVDDKDDAKRFVSVNFINTLEKTFTRSEIYPTLIYVKHCDKDNPENNVYLFGFDAKKELISHDYMPDASVFFEIKRWFGIDPEKNVHVTDEDGNEADLTYTMLIKAFLLHIIEKAEDDAKLKFNRIHFTAPVKLKAKFAAQFANMFKDADFTVESGDILDEGLSVIYETIRRNIRDNINFEKANLMVIDCGGGTTDVASCNIERKDRNDGIEDLTITTGYVGGEANFGGNNITYRIMQLIKIKLAFYYAKEMDLSKSFNNNFSVFLKEILPAPDDILNYIDADKDTKRVYKKLEEEYEIAETIIPTRFEDKNDLTKYEKKKKKIKRNFYYLWNLAENIKTEFYKKDQLTLIGFNKLSEPTMDENYENILEGFDMNFSIYVKNGKELEEKTNLPQISVTAQEVDDLIRGDIYSLLSRIFYENKNIDYKFYSFSGQSCKIRLFVELMKEFIPGKKLRNVTKTLNKAEMNDKTSEKLKTSCVKGTVYYEYDTKHGNVRPSLKCKEPEFQFKVLTEFNGRDDNILDSNSVKLFAIPEGTEYISLNIKDRFDELINRCVVDLSVEKFSTNSEKISNVLSNRTLEIYRKQIVDGISNAKSGRYCFVYPGKLGFELYAVTLLVNWIDEEVKYTISNSQLVSVEDSSQTFFDGNK